MRTSHGGGFGWRGGSGRAGIERLSPGLLRCPGVFVWVPYGSRAASEICGDFFSPGLVATRKVLGRALQLLEVERYGRYVRLSLQGLHGRR